MEVQFREIDPFNCWIWLRTANPLGQGERGYVETVFDSWFFLGKLGGFNAEALQTHEAEGAELSWLSYDVDDAERAMPALMHNMGPLEQQGCWARCWVDLGTSDAFALDVLINALRQLNNDVVEIEQLLIGGLNEDWPIEEQPESMFAGLDALDGAIDDTID
ncbi:MAG: DUF3531 family protein [Cyanobacteria bacterium M_surface_7_m2_040]|nr:DUF3531 family protein [Cyanobacteria bacterium K_Offshore_0m_m2_072]MBM5828016.1 DUF3531 family protein [Cyanobacteria bacterium M_surface_7_m2_040]